MRTIKSFLNARFGIVVLSIFLAGFFIFDHISERAFWGDEADVANVIMFPFSSLWQKAIVGGHPLLYPYVLKLWSLFFGDSELALRSFSALFGILIIIFLYKTANRFFEDKNVGLTAVLLASANYFLVWFSAQNKVYTLAAFLGLASYYFFAKLILDNPKKIDFVLYCLFSSLGAYAHPWLILVFLSQILNAFLFRKDLNNFLRILFAHAIIFVLIIPSALVILYQGKLGASAWIGSVPLRTIFESFGYFSFGGGWIYFGLVMIASFYFFRSWKNSEEIFNKKEARILKMFFVYLFFPLVAALFISQFRGAYAAGRYEFTVLPAFLLSSAVLFSKIKNRFILFSMAALIAVFCFKETLADRKAVSNYQATDKTITHDLLEDIQNGDTIIAADLSFPTFYYYSRHLNQNQEKLFVTIAYPQELSDHPGWKDLKKMLSKKDQYEKEAEDLSAKLYRERKSGRNAIWVLYNSSNPINEILREKMKKHFSEEIVELPDSREPSWIGLILKFY